MSLITVLARMEAAAAGRARPIASVRHRHLAQRPMVLVPLTTAGETGAPLGILLGTDPADPTLLTVPQPQNRDLRSAFFAELAAVLLPHLESAQDEVEFEQRRETDPETRKQVTTEVELCTDAPQLLVPGEAGVEYLRLLGRSMRFRRAPEDEELPGDIPGAHRVPLLGRWLTHYGERARLPGSALLLSMTGLLGRHWATGQSHLEDQHLSALLAWIDPPRDVDGATAALRVEQRRHPDGVLVTPPAGPATDPEFDNRRLAPAIDRYAAAGDPAGRRRAEQEISRLLEARMRPTWEAMWRGIELLRTLPEGGSVAERRRGDRRSYTMHRNRVRDGEPPQPRQDDAVTAARKLAARERAQAGLDAQEAWDDPLVMAQRRLAGEAFEGEVTAVEPAYTEGSRPRPRPLVTVCTDDRPQLDGGTTVHRVLGDGRAQKGECVRICGPPEDDPDHSAGPLTVVVRLTGGMGRGREPEPGTVPEKGDRLCWTLFELRQSAGQAGLPEEVPWTHGGRPEPQDPAPEEPDPVTDEDLY